MQLSNTQKKTLIPPQKLHSNTLNHAGQLSNNTKHSDHRSNHIATH